MTTPTGPATPAATWHGTTTLQPGWLAFTGAVGHTEPHAHAAIQVMIVLGGDVHLADAHTTHRVQRAIIPPRARHALHASPGARATMIYLDPASSAGHHLLTTVNHRRDQAGAASWMAAAHAIPAKSADAASGGALDAAHLVGSWAVSAGAPVPGRRSPVLQRALQLLPEMLATGSVRLTDLADAAAVSASRLGHLFTAELALPFPAYLRWARLRRAMELAQAGATLTEAAHGAGFADSSHLTRTCHEMFGLAPSHLVQAIRPAGQPGRAGDLPPVGR